MDAEALDHAISEAVREVEAASDVELVVVLANRAERYLDLSHGIGAVAAWVALAFAIYSPFVVAPWALMLETVVLYVLVTWGARRAPRLLRLLSSAGRREAAVARLAKVVFVEEAVTGTRNRTGILALYCQLEGRLQFRPDAGVLGAVSEAGFHRLEAEFHAGSGPFEARLDAALRGITDLVKDALPRLADDENELEDSPRRREV